MASLKERFDFVLVDAPPVLPLADVPTLCRDLDGAIMVVRAGATPSDLVQEALGSLYGVTVHGRVLNDVEARLSAEPLRLMRASAGLGRPALPPRRA